ncbi:MAG: DUF255 domain-containing protein [Bacteroidia bacterium]|nr:DUF255 domain-containing protein [Bacteroidia bacterium]MDW8157450.1 DUF255 domain-containing protein [Bacteroidia bacterium]
MKKEAIIKNFAAGLKLFFGFFLGVGFISTGWSYFLISTPPTWKKWEDAYALAVKEKRIIILDVYTDWCGWCKKMDKDTYENPQVLESIQKKFVAVKINPEKNVKYLYKGQTYTAAQLLRELTRIAGEGISGYPTTLFVVPRENAQDHVHVVGGYLGPKEFLQALSQLQAYYP